VKEWPQYQSHKVVRAVRILSNTLDEYGQVVSLTVDGPNGWEQFIPTEPAMMARAQIGGFAVLYPDGYKSVSPAREFEQGYAPVRS
jgi:hypothetical protein